MLARKKVKKNWFFLQQKYLLIVINNKIYEKYVSEEKNITKEYYKLKKNWIFENLKPDYTNLYLIKNNTELKILFVFLNIYFEQLL